MFEIYSAFLCNRTEFGFLVFEKKNLFFTNFTVLAFVGFQISEFWSE